MGLQGTAIQHKCRGLLWRGFLKRSMKTKVSQIMPRVDNSGKVSVAVPVAAVRAIWAWLFSVLSILRNGPVRPTERCQHQAHPG